MRRPTKDPFTRPAMQTLERLHAELGGRILENKTEGDTLRLQMQQVEAVLKLLDPSYDVRPIAVKRRTPNPWFKRGTVYRSAVDVLRTAETPLTAREIADRMLAAKGVTDAEPAAVTDLSGSVNSSLQNHKGKGVRQANDGSFPARWSIS